MSKECIIKYTIIPANDKEDYEKNFKLSLSEFCKATNSDKALVCPLIVYNSELDISLDLDRSIEDFIVYSDKEDLVATIRRHENSDVIRSLIIHGFDITLDEVRDIYCPISRRGDLDICINTIQDMELDSNLTFYLYNDLDDLEEDEWRETKNALEEDMLNYIEEYKAVGALENDELIDMLPFLFGDGDDEELDALIEKIKNKDKKEEPEKVNAPVPLFKDEPRPVPQQQLNNKAITCSYEDGEDFFSISKVEEDMFIIEDNDYEMLFTADQIDFLFQQYNRIKDK
jgi:hypothetical protein